MEVSDEIEVLDVISHDKCILTTNYRDCFLSTADFPLFSFHPWAGCSFLLFSPRTLFPVSPKAAHRVENNIFSSYLIFFSKDILENSHCASSLISYSKKPTEGYLYRLKTQEYGNSKCSKLRIYWSQLPCISSFSKAGFFYFSAEDRTHGLAYTRQMLYNYATTQAWDKNCIVWVGVVCHWWSIHLGISSKGHLL